mmetsp:Transcript_84480/g.136908  ORF Transcript_84480/g.136908 Transcript_84480/m.136908 type:complete len:108 (-) Transcript_84480:225-548(-)
MDTCMDKMDPLQHTHGGLSVAVCACVHTALHITLSPEPGEKQSCWLIQQGVVLSNSALGWFECGGRRANLWQAIRKTPGGAAPWQRSALPSTFVKRLALHGLLIPAC